MNSSLALIALSGMATVLCGSLGAYATGNASAGQARAAQADTGPLSERDELCIVNETDAIIYYDVMWGSERKSYSIGPGMEAVHEGTPQVAPFVEFTDGQIPSTAPQRVKAQAGGCDTAKFAFRYPTASALKRQGGYYLFGEGIEAQQYVRADSPETEYRRIREQQLAWAQERMSVRHPDIYSMENEVPVQPSVLDAGYNPAEPEPQQAVRHARATASGSAGLEEVPVRMSTTATTEPLAPVGKGPAVLTATKPESTPRVQISYSEAAASTIASTSSLDGLDR
ncbi:MAG: hypothetical protein KDE55_22655 [Novosphingobium sp.]|nr:hypothetical protein [Novosphingobium sp.]